MVLFRRRWARHQATLRPEDLAQLAAWGLAHPRGENRVITILALDSEPANRSS